MRKLLVSVAIATATIAAVPAAAQYHGNGSHYGWNQRGPDRRAVQQLLARVDQAELRIDRSARRGMISPREAFGLRREANQLRRQISYASRDGLTGREFGQLQVRVNRLDQRVRNERRDYDRHRG